MPAAKSHAKPNPLCDGGPVGQGRGCAEATQVDPREEIGALSLKQIQTLIHSFERHREGATETDREIFHPRLSPQMAATGRAGPDQSQGPGTPSGSAPWVGGPKLLSHHQLPSRCISRELHQKQ